MPSSPVAATFGLCGRGGGAALHRVAPGRVGGCGRPGASRGVLSFSLRSLLTEPPSVIDVAYWPSLFSNSGPVVKTLQNILAGSRVLSAVGACPPHDGVR